MKNFFFFFFFFVEKEMKNLNPNQLRIFIRIK